MISHQLTTGIHTPFIIMVKCLIILELLYQEDLAGGPQVLLHTILLTVPRHKMMLKWMNKC
jgi:hypothetical protein